MSSRCCCYRCYLFFLNLFHFRKVIDTNQFQTNIQVRLQMKCSVVVFIQDQFFFRRKDNVIQPVDLR